MIELTRFRVSNYKIYNISIKYYKWDFINVIQKSFYKFNFLSFYRVYYNYYIFVSKSLVLFLIY